jgi:hypothetical protein
MTVTARMLREAYAEMLSPRGVPPCGVTALERLCIVDPGGVKFDKDEHGPILRYYGPVVDEDEQRSVA